MKQQGKAISVEYNQVYGLKKLRELIFLFMLEVIFLATPLSFLWSAIVAVILIVSLDALLTHFKYTQPADDDLKRIRIILLVLVFVIVPLGEIGTVRNARMAYFNSFKPVEVTMDNIVGEYVDANISVSFLNLMQTMNLSETLDHSELSINHIVFNEDGTFERTCLIGVDGEEKQTGTFTLMNQELTLQSNEIVEHYFIDITENNWLDEESPMVFLNLYSDPEHQHLSIAEIGNGAY